MTDEQYLYLYRRVRPHLIGIPDPKEYVPDLGQAWEIIKAHSTDEAESKRAFEVLCTFRRILDAAYMKGEKL